MNITRICEVTSLQFNVLGPLQVLSQGDPVPIGGPKQQTLLSFLILRANTVVTVPKLIDALWAHEPPRTALAQVHSRISSLRQTLGVDVIETHSAGYSLTTPADSIDSRLFEGDVTHATGLLTEGRNAEAIEVFRRSLGRWRSGPAFQQLEGGLFDREASRLEELRMLALEQRISAELTNGDAAELVPELVDLVAAHPTQERLHHHLMVALDRSGRRSDAINAYWNLRQRLVEELGTDPSADIRDLYTRLLADSPAKETSHPARETAAPRGAQWAGSDAQSQLPPDIPDFVGRDRETQQVVGSLATGSADHPGTAAPAVIISGMPGVGKSMLALHAAHVARRAFPDGHLYVDASTFPRIATSLREVLGRLLRGLGVRDEALPDCWQQRQDLYRSVTSSRSVLVLIDNLVEDEDLRPVIPTGQRSAIWLTTQVSRLSVDGAVRIPLGSLDQGEAEALLLSGIPHERFSGQDRQVREVLAICGGLPVALRSVGNLLAARPHWSIEQVRALLTRCPDPASRLTVSGRSLAETFEDACARLPEGPMRALPALAAFKLEQLTPSRAGALVGCSVSTASELLDELADRNLLIPRRSSAESGYVMHELMRAHLRAKMTNSEFQAVLSRALRSLPRRARRSLFHKAVTAGRPAIDPSQDDATLPATAAAEPDADTADHHFFRVLLRHAELGARAAADEGRLRPAPDTTSDPGEPRSVRAGRDGRPS